MALLRFRAFTNVPWFLPGVLVSMAIGYLVRRRVSRWLEVAPIVGWAVVVALGLIVSATLTPLHEGAFHVGSTLQGCDFTRIGPASIDEILQFDDTILNIALFVPLGACLAIVPSRLRRVGLVLAALAFPVVIETTQLLVKPLDRACQSADVADNITGLLVGLGLGSILWLLRSWMTDRPSRR
jgi:glycopeptide antibiotics resistance protein